MSKTKVAIFDLTGCEGCEFHLLSLNELLLDIFQDFEVTNWRLLSEKEKKDFDIAFIEGAATTEEHIKLLKEIRKTSKIVVALGACAISGNIFAELTPEQRKKLAPKIYNKNYQLKAKFLEPIEKFIKVDEKIPGCPPNLETFKKFLEKIKNKTINSKFKEVTPPDYIARIEGHGKLTINFKEKKAAFEVEESERLIEGLLLGKNYQKAPFINARICGICPVAHNLCSWKALENALKIKLSPEAIILREIMLAAQMIKSHLLHLFFLVLPDYAGLKSSIELSVKYPREFHLMLNIKRVSEKALEIIAGSTAFPINTTLGGFLKPPKKDSLLVLNQDIYDVLDKAQDLINLFANFKILPLKTNIQFLSLIPLDKKYPLYQGKIDKSIKEVIFPDSPAKLGVLDNGQVVKTGAMARMKRFPFRLNPQAQKAWQKYQPNLNNPFNNNLAQAIEILHYLEEIVKLINNLADTDLNKAKGIVNLPLSKKQSRGEAYLEAPRGVLFHQVALNSQGKIIDYNIVPPTQINLASLEKEAQLLVNQYTNFENKAITKEVEKLIRAFDPCISCAVH